MLTIVSELVKSTAALREQRVDRLDTSGSVPHELLGARVICVLGLFLKVSFI